MPVVVRLELDGPNHAELAVESPVVEPVDVLDRRDLEVRDAAPGPLVADEFDFEDRVHRLREGVVVAVALGADRRDRACFGESVGVADCSLLDSAVAVVDQLAEVVAFSLRRPDAHLEGVEDEVGVHVLR